MSFNLNNKVNNLTNLISSTIPSSGVVVCNNLTATTASIPTLSSTSIASGTLTCGNITATQTYNLSSGIGISTDGAGQIGMLLTTPNASKFTVGQTVLVQGTDNGYYNNRTFVITIITLPNILQTNNPYGIPSYQYGAGGTVSSGSITTLDLTTTNGTITNATINTSLISNSIASKATTALTLNSNNTGSLGEIILQKGGTTYGTIQNANASYNLQLMSESGMSLDTKANGNINIGANGTGSINFFTNSVLRAAVSANGIITTKYANAGNNNTVLEAFDSGNNPALVFNSRSSNSSTAVGRWGYINNSGWVFEDGVSSNGQTQSCGINATGFYVPNAGYFLNGARANTAFGTSYATNDIIIYNNAGGSISFNNQTNLYSNCLYRAGRASIYYRPDEINYWSVSVNSISAFYISQAGGYSYYLSGGQTNGNWTWSSDERLKTNIQLAPSFLETVLSIPVKTYNYIKNPDVLCVGYTAQDLKKLPQLIDVVSDTPDLAPDGTPYLGVSGGSLLPYLIKAFQEQNELIVNQQKQIDELKLLVNQLISSKQ